MATASKSTLGRPKGLIWNYFDFNTDECDSRCIVNIGSGDN